MAIVRRPQQIYIYRNIDAIIGNYIEEETPKLLFIHGQGGVGKSTLLKKFLSYDAKEIPTVLINMQENSSQSFVDMLLDEEITTIKHCPNFENLRELLLKEPKLLKAIGSLDSDSIEKGVDEYIDEEYGEYAKAIVDILKMGAKWKKKELEEKKKEFLNNPEYVLLSALAEDFKEYGLFMVDTFEKIKNSNIKSKITFLDSGEISMSLKEKNYRLKDYVEGLVYLLVENSTFIIAGRNSQDELNMEVPLDYVDELSLENFSISNITELFRIYSDKDSKLSMPTAQRIEQIHNLTNGNPLLVGLFPKVAKEYDSWDELDYEEMERRIKTDDEFGLLFYMTDRVLTHLDESTEVWKLVIPRVLNREIEKLLFKDEKILKELIEVGLATKGTGRDSERYYLHDDVHRAIVAYYEREFKGGFSSWHDYEKVAELHRELMEFYEKHGELHGVNSAFEGCYHKIMLREGFEKDFQIGREEFASFTLGALGISLNKKMALCQDWETIEKREINQYIQDLRDEKDRANISSELYDRFSKDLVLGVVDSLEDIDYLTKLSKGDEFKNDWSIFYVLGIAYDKKGEYDQAIEAYQKAVEINPKDDSTYYNMGSAYNDKGEYAKAIEAYQKAIEINPKKDDVYYNMGISYDKKGEYDQAIEAYQKAVEINFKNDMAYNNMGNAYSNKREYDKAIKAYKEAIEINPKNDMTYYNMGIIYSNKKEYDQAIESYNKVIKINPKHDKAYHNIGIAYGNKEEYDKAIEACQKAVEINPKKDEAYYIIGLLCENKEEYDKAIEAYQKAIEINPKKDDVYYNMGITYDKKGEYYQAIEAYQKAVEINFKNDMAYYNMGIAYGKKGEYDKAIKAYKEAIEINPQKDGVYYNMGIAYYWLGKFDKVIESYIKAININPNNSGAYTNLFELQLTQNQPFDQSLEKKYIELFQNQKDKFLKYEMLKILQDIVQNQEVNLEEWVQKYRGVDLGSWSFDELYQWIDGVEDEVLKVKLCEAIEVFEGHG